MENAIVFLIFQTINILYLSYQEALLEMCGEEVALYLSNKPVTMTAANTVAMRVSPSYERS